MQDLDTVLSDTDGLKAFNLMYCSVTKAIDDAVAAGGIFSDAPWIVHLDVVFANLYFAAVSQSLEPGDTVPAAWEPLFDSRFDPHIARIQYALAGMNAHINRDLVVALERTHIDLGTTPDRNTVHYRDFNVVNGILAAVEAQVKPQLLTGVYSAIDGTLGPLDDVMAMWSIERAREAAWTHSEVFWTVRSGPFLTAGFLEVLDQMTGFASRGLLVPTQP